MRVGSGVILFQLAGFLTSALADFYFAKHMDVLVKISVAERDERSRRRSECLLFITNNTAP